MEEIVIEPSDKPLGVDYNNPEPFNNDAYELFHVTAERDQLQKEVEELRAKLAKAIECIPFPWCLDWMGEL